MTQQPYFYDIETISDCFVAVLKAKNDNMYHCFVKSSQTPTKLRNNIILHSVDDMEMFIRQNVSFIIGFNNESFDNQVVCHAFKNNFDFSAINYMADKRINGAKYPYDYWQNTQAEILGCRSIDLVKINHYDNKARMTSLKWLSYSYRSRSIKDLPIQPEDSVDTPKKLTDLIIYCCKDVDETENCYNKSLKMIENRLKYNKIVRKRFPSFDCLNYSDVKIGEQLALLEYSDLVNVPYSKIKNLTSKHIDKVALKDVIPDYIKFKTPLLQEHLKEIRKMELNPNEEEFKYSLDFEGTTYTFGKGGIHSVDDYRILKPKDDEYLIDSDVGSQYPSSLARKNKYPRHLTKEWIEMVKTDILDRVNVYKPAGKKGDDNAQSMADMIKLKLNGGIFGKLNSEYSFQYDPEIFLSVTIGCQLEILMLIESLSLNGFKVKSANTDGIMTLMKKKDHDLFLTLCSEWEKNTNSTVFGTLEHTFYRIVIQNAVNDYLAVDEYGNIKRKGFYLQYEDYDDNYHKNPSALIIPIAIENYFLKNDPVEKTIKKHKDIYDFCIGVKKNKTFEYLGFSVNDGMVTGFNKYTDKALRFYCSTNGESLYKLFNDLRLVGQMKDSLVTVAQYIRNENALTYDNINYDYYINKANEVIDKILQK